MLEGYFRTYPPKVPLLIEPLQPGTHSAVIEVLATGTYTLRFESTDDECTRANAIQLVVDDYHCGFLP